MNKGGHIPKKSPVSKHSEFKGAVILAAACGSSIGR